MMLMIVGLIGFSLADVYVQPKFNSFGLILISFALLADGVIGNVQERTMKQYNCASAEMVAKMARRHPLSVTCILVSFYFRCSILMELAFFTYLPLCWCLINYCLPLHFVFL